MISLGIDVGSLFTKAVLLDDDQMLASAMRETTGNISGEIEDFINEVASRGGVSRQNIEICVSAGQGEDLVEQADFSEDTVVCIAMASRHLLPESELAVDVGGQSITTVISDAEGEVANFMHNDKCASGSGRFIEVISSALGVNMNDLDEIAGKAQKTIPVSTQCAVFAESEIVSYVNQGEAVPDLIAAVCEAVARIVVSQALRFGTTNNYTVTGGVGRISAVVNVLEKRLQGNYYPFPIDPRLAVAYGASLLGQMEE